VVDFLDWRREHDQPATRPATKPDVVRIVIVWTIIAVLIEVSCGGETTSARGRLRDGTPHDTMRGLKLECLNVVS
jgi:hypothetical protein